MSSAQDWTSGPAKWAAVLALGGASVFGIAWSVLTRGSHAAAPTPSSAVQALPAEEPGPPSDPQTQKLPAQSTAVPVSPVVRRININTATAAELELLPGIGPALAGRIVEYRQANGGFKNVDQLDDVKGIGARTLDKLRPLVKVE